MFVSSGGLGTPWAHIFYFAFGYCWYPEQHLAHGRCSISFHTNDFFKKRQQNFCTLLFKNDDFGTWLANFLCPTCHVTHFESLKITQNTHPATRSLCYRNYCSAFPFCILYLTPRSYYGSKCLPLNTSWI